MTTATLQRERPGLFSTPMVRAIDEDRKTNTRRMVKLPKPYRWDDEQKGMVVDDPGHGRWHIEELTHLAPYQVGDTIWVRETHVIGLLESPVEDRVFQKIEDDEFRSEYGNYLVPYYFAIDEDPHLTTEDAAEGDDRTRWKPSIHMPRWAARLFLKVTNVRVERLQEILELDAIAEGINRHDPDKVLPRDLVAQWFSYGQPEIYFNNPIDSFHALWSSIYPGTWNANPWVWVIKFEKMTAV